MSAPGDAGLRAADRDGVRHLEKKQAKQPRSKDKDPSE